MLPSVAVRLPQDSDVPRADWHTRCVALHCQRNNCCLDAIFLATGVNWYDLSYQNWCVRQGAMKQTADLLAAVGLNASEITVPGQEGPLRFAEGVDSINNIVQSTNAPTNAAASGYLLCSITQAGGLLYTFIVITLVSLLLVFVPIVNWTTRFIYDAGVVAAAQAGYAAAVERSQRPPELKRRVAKVDLVPPKKVKEGGGLGGFLRRRAANALSGARGAARGARGLARGARGAVGGVRSVANLPNRLPGFNASQRLAVRGGVGLNRAALAAGRGTARGAISLGRGTYSAGRGTVRAGAGAGRLGLRAGRAGARFAANDPFLRTAGAGAAAAAGAASRTRAGQALLARRDRLSEAYGARRDRAVAYRDSAVASATERRDRLAQRAGAVRDRAVARRNQVVDAATDTRNRALDRYSRAANFYDDGVRRFNAFADNQEYNSERYAGERRAVNRAAVSAGRQRQLRERAAQLRLQEFSSDPTTRNGARLQEARRGLGEYRESVSRAIAQRAQVAGDTGRWSRLVPRSQAVLAPYDPSLPQANAVPIPQAIPLARPAPRRAAPAALIDVEAPRNVEEDASDADLSDLGFLFDTSAHPSQGAAGPISKMYMSPPAVACKRVPDAESAWSTLLGVAAEAYAQRGISIKQWLAALHTAFDRRTVSKDHASILFGMGFNAHVPWIVALEHAVDAPFARCNREYGIHAFDAITRESARSATGEVQMSKRAFTEWYTQEVPSGRARASGFEFACFDDESAELNAMQADGALINVDGNDAFTETVNAPRGFLTGLMTRAHDSLHSLLTRGARFEAVSPDETDTEQETNTNVLVPDDDVISHYESDLETDEEEVFSDDEDAVASSDGAGHLMLPDAMTGGTAQPARWGWAIGR